MSERVRFAPSPTGYIHVGNVRTALANYLCARKSGGQFILRLDDTDVERSTVEYADGIREDLTWLGLNWDETFAQSERVAEYEKAAEKLKADGRLYACYETPEELDVKRKVQLSRSLPPVYDRAALALTADDVAAFEAEGRTPHWRFKLNPEVVSWNDGIRGDVRVDLASLSDPVLVRADGSLLYTLPSVVDDIDYGITRVFRGEDHVTNTAAQIQVYQALGGDVPAFSHHALLTGAKGEGLSKRLGTLSIRDLRESGLEAMAINSLLARLGTSDPIEPFTELAPLVESFDESKMSRSSAKFDPVELDALNAKVLHHMSFDQVSDRVPAEVDAALWETLGPNLSRLSDLDGWLDVIHGPIQPIVEDSGFLAYAATLLPEGNWDDDTWKAWTGAVKDQTGRKGRDLFMPLRQALTGLDHGPEMKHMLPLIGPERTKARLRGEAA
ncbi:MAG: glutamate--tRNA ligase [Alphaproteobacteria bacterium]|nr:MAG: glutamate--tRNA ligase [Alphaproteobacteria bacterium]